MSSLTSISILTPLYDPSGAALSYFEKCVRSVERQVNIDFQWILSIQEVHESYIPVLRSISVPTLILERQQADSISTHLNLLIEDAPQQKVHILCQDDYYTGPRSLKHISDALESSTVVFIRPANHKKRRGLWASCHAGAFDRLRKVSNASGVNRFGGLSTIAWVHSQSARISLTHSYFADLELRRQLLDLVPEESPLILVRSIVCESLWSGQAQNTLSTLLVEEETRRWVCNQNQSALNVWLFVAWSSLWRESTLADEWMKSATFPWLAVAMGKSIQALIHASLNTRKKYNVSHTFKLQLQKISQSPTNLHYQPDSNTGNFGGVLPDEMIVVSKKH